MGDFNTTFYATDRQNTIRCNAEINIAESLKEMMDNLNLSDSWPRDDGRMTWRHGDKMSKIDRILVSDSLIHSTEITTDWSITESDHCAVIVTVNKTKMTKPPSRIVRLDTRFMSNVLSKQLFLRELDTRMGQLSECTMNPHQRLEFLKMSIRSIAIEQASIFKKKSEAKFNEIKEQINFWQKTFEASSISSVRDLAMQNLDRATIERDSFLDDRGKYLSEWAKSRWYQEGERGTKYFLNMLRAKSNKLEMSQLIVDQGPPITNPNEINKEVERFYRKLYEKGNRSKTDANDFLSHMSKISDENIRNITSPLTALELFNTLKSCSDSAPGPDGIPYSVIRLTWKYFGPLLIDSWLFSTECNDLTPSHKDSYLRLLPKDGKDLNLLKNWRPITLSNCDIKLITKTLSQRLGNNLGLTIGHQQTAYLKDRQITDNLNLMQHVIERSNELNSPSMIVSLDAEKAFDSIEHWYIKEVLRKIGLDDFCKTFDLLYKGQEVKILLNKQIAGSYSIKNGVKQGDALSCILFILGIEPLIKNIERDDKIKGITLGNTVMPKVLSYADDVACLIEPTQQNLDAVFRNYESMTKFSGLKLNAEKTEIIGLRGQPNYEVNYLSSRSEIMVSHTIKINGLYLSFDTASAMNQNMSRLLACLEQQLQKWSKRYLSILGKIQIFKTFGLSQILFIASTVLIPQKIEKRITELIYKFIWNNDMNLKKAPDRLKRSILKCKVKDLGFGMIDYKEVVYSIRVKMFQRLKLMTTHPMHVIISNNVTSSVINLSNINTINACVDNTIKELNKRWKLLLQNPPQDQISLLKKIILNEYIGNILVPRGRRSRLGRTHRHDKLNEIPDLSPNHPIMNKLEKKIATFLKSNWHVNIPSNTPEKDNVLCPTRTKILIEKFTSKGIRMADSLDERITPKSLSNTTGYGLKKLGYTISKLTNCKLQTIILRALHGDIYSKSRMVKFGMLDSDLCERCGEQETTSHLLLECNYVRQLWELCSKITSVPTTDLNAVLGYHDFHDKTTLTIHCEVIRRLLAIDRPILHQNKLLKSVIDRLGTVEKGISKITINDMKNELLIITQSTTV